MSAPKMLYVSWIDSCHTPGWLGSHEIAYVGDPMSCSSCGFVVKETKAALVLALSRTDGGSPWGHLITIPHAAITSRKVLR